MGHFFAIVLIKPDTENIEAAVKELLQPYSRSHRAPGKVYLDPDHIKVVAEQHGLKPQDSAGLAGQLKSWLGFEGGFDENGVYYVSPNPNGKFSDWRFGGRQDGYIKGKPRRDGRGNHGPEFTRLENNRVPVQEMPADTDCLAVVTPDGQWFERPWIREWPKGDQEPLEEVRWKAQARRLFDQYRECIAVGVDCAD